MEKVNGVFNDKNNRDSPPTDAGNDSMEESGNEYIVITVREVPLSFLSPLTDRGGDGVVVIPMKKYHCYSPKFVSRGIAVVF